jgi:hypothetical protein
MVTLTEWPRDQIDSGAHWFDYQTLVCEKVKLFTALSNIIINTSVENPSKDNTRPLKTKWQVKLHFSGPLMWSVYVARLDLYPTCIVSLFPAAISLWLGSRWCPIFSNITLVECHQSLRLWNQSSLISTGARVRSVSLLIRWCYIAQEILTSSVTLNELQRK